MVKPPPASRKALPVLPYRGSRLESDVRNDLHFPSKSRDLYGPLLLLTTAIGLTLLANGHSVFRTACMELGPILLVDMAMAILTGVGAAWLTRFTPGPWASATIKLCALGAALPAIIAACIQWFGCFGIIMVGPITIIAVGAAAVWFFDIDLSEGLLFSIVLCSMAVAGSGYWFFGYLLTRILPRC